jgi:hypothetical protein
MKILNEYLDKLNESPILQKVKLISKITSASIFGISVLGLVGIGIYGSLKDRKKKSDEDYRKCMIGCNKILIMINKLEQELKKKYDEVYLINTDEKHQKLTKMYENCYEKCCDSYNKKMLDLKKEADDFKKKHKRG